MERILILLFCFAALFLSVDVNADDSNLTNATCYYFESSDTYNITFNGTNVSKNNSLYLNICYNITDVYCDSNGSISLYRIEGSDKYNCGSNECYGLGIRKITNPYNMSNETFENSTSFMCWAKKTQDASRIWLYGGLDFFNDKTILVFDFYNTTFIDNEIIVNNTYIYNITNNITNDIINNITFAANLTDIENRLSFLEDWRLSIIEILNYIIGTINNIISNPTNYTNVTTSFNLTNITIPVQNNTNITIPSENNTIIINNTNITIPSENNTIIINNTNITIPAQNITINNTNITIPAQNNTNITIPAENITIIVPVIPIDIAAICGNDKICIAIRSRK
jgi:hypothetical protein